MNDYQAGLRHNLEIIEVFDENFKMGNLVPEYQGMDLLEARQKIVEKLKRNRALVKKKKNIHIMLENVKDVKIQLNQKFQSNGL